MVTVVPAPSADSTLKSPSWFATIVRAMDMPRPDPGTAPATALDARKNLVNRAAWSGAGMPIPVSATVSTAASPSQASEVLTCPPLGVFHRVGQQVDQDPVEL